MCVSLYWNLSHPIADLRASAQALTTPRCWSVCLLYRPLSHPIADLCASVLKLITPNYRCVCLRRCPCIVILWLRVEKQGTVDYIFYGPGPLLETSNNTDGGRSSPDSPALGEAASRLAVAKRSGLRCVGVSEPPLRPDLDHFGGLPSPEEPSDHVLLAVRFEIVPPQP